MEFLQFHFWMPPALDVHGRRRVRPPLHDTALP